MLRVLICYYQVVPIAHASKHLASSTDNNIRLCSMLNSATWMVKVNFTGHSYRLGKGWKEYVNANAISMNDCCVFELKNEDEMEEEDGRILVSYNVSIIRA
jgi:hypothetical protein